MKSSAVPLLILGLLTSLTGAIQLNAADSPDSIRPAANADRKGTVSFISAPRRSPAVMNVPAPYLNLIRHYSTKHNLREDLVIAVIRAESSFNPNAVSHKGAVGLMQLMPVTAAQYGVSDRFNVDQNLDAGIRHLKYLYERYNQDISLTLAAYNAGEEAVKKYGGVPPFRETRDYIRRINGFLGLNNGNSPGRSRIYKFVTPEGRIMITDTLPSKQHSGFEVLE